MVLPFNLNRFGATQKKRPYYCEVEYLESTGTQYIGTGVLPVNDMDFECKFTFTSLVNTNLTIIGSRDGEKRCQPIGVYNNKWSASIGGSYDANGTAVSANTPYIIKSTITNGQTITTNVNGSQASTCTSTTGLPSQELYIFARNFYGNTDPADSKVNGRLYFLKIKANGVLVRDFIPVLDWSYVPCMYDRVSGQLFYNQGTGTFQYGREIHYVDYLEANGTQYIDTGFKVDDTCGYDISWMALNGDDRIIIGTKGSYDSRWVLSGNNNPFLNVSWNSVFTGDGLGLNKIQTAKMNYLNDRKRLLNGIEKTPITETLSSSASTYNVGIFAGCWGSGTFSLFSTCRIYYAKITKGSDVVRDFIPAIDENGVGFMFDRVSHTCFLNAGTGNFATGKVIEKEYE